MSFNNPKATLAFENGVVLEGNSFGARHAERIGEVVFNTAMTGYQEIITDPSYKGQMVLMTAPQIGNTGINDIDNESNGLHLEGMIVKDYCKTPSNWQSKKTLGEFLAASSIPAICNIDTRFLTRMLRTEGSLKACLSTRNEDKTTLIEKAKAAPSLEGQNLAALVSTKKMYVFENDEILRDFVPQNDRLMTPQFHVVAIDLGIKTSILKQLAISGCRVTVVPWNTPSKEILRLNPDGILLSNGPGDPAAVRETIETAKELIGQKPIFGICLGHQILANALGGTTSKLKFGHHGANHPVQNLMTRHIEITSQNHGFVVDFMSLKDKKKDKNIEMTHLNLNDQTVEGLRDIKNKIFTVQYHPEASPGPHDSRTLFTDFVHLMEKNA